MKREIFTFWTGNNEIPEYRWKCLGTLKQRSGCNILVIRPSILDRYILPEHPLHSAYEYLSEVHKADYLRTYFMNFYGGAYSDIKGTRGSWLPSFEEIEKREDIWIVGYKEIPGGVAYPHPSSDRWRELIGNCAYICKPHTSLTEEWYSEMIALLDTKLEKLKEHPAKHPRDNYHPGVSEYPIEWNEMLGRIFHKVAYKYKDKVSRILPMIC
jgi:hypothetical protein